VTNLQNLAVAVVKKHHTIEPKLSVASHTVTQPFCFYGFYNNSRLAISTDYVSIYLAKIQISECY
jgi:hypothetical protein